MAIFKCDSCGYEQEVPDKLAGRKAKCPICTEGVTIVDVGMAEDLAAMFEEDVPERAEDIPDGAEVASSIDLDDHEETVDIADSDDVACGHCGIVILDSEGHDHCPECGVELSKPLEVEDLAEGELDVSDLADDEPPQVWETGFKSEDVAASLESDEPERESSFLAGGLFVNIFAGLVSGVLAFFFAMAMSLLASSQTGMHEFLPVILTAGLASMCVGCLVYSVQSRIPFALAGPGTVLTGILFLFLGAIYQDMEGVFVSETILATLLAAIVLTTLVAGVGLWIIGTLRVGNLIRYVPVQIIGGVIGGVGVYVVIGALDWIGRLELDWSHLFTALIAEVPRLAPAEFLSSMGPSILFGLVLFAGLMRRKNSLYLLGILVVATIAGYSASIWGGGTQLAGLAAPILELQNGVELFSIQALRFGFHDIQWDVIQTHGIHIGALGCLMALTSIYRVTKLELINGKDVDPSRELRSLGRTNIISAICGGMPVGISNGRSVGNHASGARSPLAGVIAGLVVGAGLYFIDTVVLYIPRFVPEGVLLFAGLAVIRGWMFNSRTAFTRRDDLVMLWVTFFVTVTLGMVIGIGFGVALALMATVRRHSLGGPIRNILSGSAHRSNVDRSPAQHRVLKEYGDHIYIVRLQGFLFLGSLEDMLDRLKGRLSDRSLLPLEFVILDFKMVTGLSSAASIGFRKLHRLMEEYDVELVIASAPLDLEEHLAESGLLSEESGAFRVFLDIDYAMEWCENRVLDGENLLHMRQLSLNELLNPVFPDPKQIDLLKKVSKRMVVKRGNVVFRQGDPSEALYFVESGKLDVELEMEGGKMIRLKKVGPGAVFGEMGIYTAAPRSASVRATDKSVLYYMTKEQLTDLEQRAPRLVAIIHRFIINLMAERIGEANFKVRELMR